MRLASLVDTAARVAGRGSRLAKIDALAVLLGSAQGDDISRVVAFLAGELPRGKVGIGQRLLRGARPALAASASSLTLADVDAALLRIEAASGAGSQRAKLEELSALLAAATAAEQDFLERLLLGELRQGALLGVMAEAVARAAGLDAAAVRRATMVSGDLRAASLAALLEGAQGLERFRVEVFRPLHPMLAQPAAGLEEALEKIGLASPAEGRSGLALELKIDGARVQVHRRGDEIRVYTRGLNEVTAAVPEVVEVVAAATAFEVILDGEVFAVRDDGSARPFQDTMRRFGRKLDIVTMRSQLPLQVRFFDCLLRDGRELIDAPLAARWDALAELFSERHRIAQLRPQRREDAESFFDLALEQGHEGLMAKDLAAPYQAGSRGSAWLKIKPAHTLDLVVLGAEWGSGRRQGWLSNLHLGARDELGELGPTGGFVMLGKTFKGLTDELLAWQTKALSEIAVSGDDGWVVMVEPRLVVEIALNNVQASPHYPAGLALRFARVKRYRPDKTADQASTLEEVREIFRREHGRSDR
jgi:DNA ligase-1